MTLERQIFELAAGSRQTPGRSPLRIGRVSEIIPGVGGGPTLFVVGEGTDARQMPMIAPAVPVTVGMAVAWFDHPSNPVALGPLAR